MLLRRVLRLFSETSKVNAYGASAVAVRAVIVWPIEYDRIFYSFKTPEWMANWGISRPSFIVMLPSEDLPGRRCFGVQCHISTALYSSAFSSTAISSSLFMVD